MSGSPRSLLWGGVLLLLFVEVATRNVVDLDVFHEMALFREWIASGEFPVRDVFAYTPTVVPVVHHEWGTGAVLYFATVWTGWGSGGLIALRYALVALTAAACYMCARSRGADDRVAVLLAPLAILLVVPALGPIRAQAFSIAFLSLLLLLLEYERRGERWWIPLWLGLYVAWLNLHGGFLIGAGLFFLFVVEALLGARSDSGSFSSAFRKTYHLWATGIVMVPLTFVNPYGAGYVSYLWSAVRLDRTPVAEWAPVWDPQWIRSAGLIFATTLLFVVYAVVRKKDPRKLPGLLLLLAAAYFAARHVRHTSLYAVVWFSFVPAYLSTTEFGVLMRNLARRFPRGAVAALVILPLLPAVRQEELPRPLEVVVPNSPNPSELYYPVGAVRYLREQGFTGNLMTPYASGSYVSWKLFPDVRVGMDSRWEVAYPRESAYENLALYSASGEWRDILERYPSTDAVLVPRTSPLDSLLLERPSAAAWRRVYVDGGFSVFLRSSRGDPLPFVDRRDQRVEGRFP